MTTHVASAPRGGRFPTNRGFYPDSSGRGAGRYKRWVVGQSPVRMGRATDRPIMQRVGGRAAATPIIPA